MPDTGAVWSKTEAGACGGVEISFADRQGRTVLNELHQSAPCRAFIPENEPDDPPLAVFVNTSGGCVGGDRLHSKITLAPHCHATLTTQAAEKIYRSLGATCRITTELTGESGSVIEWLPQETILFDAARLERNLHISLAKGAKFLGTELVYFGRRARGEQFDHGHLIDRWRLEIGGKLVWADTIRLTGQISATRTRPFGFADAAAYGSLVLVGFEPNCVLEAGRAIAVDCLARHAGATVVNGILVMRFADSNAALVREAVAQSIIRLRAEFLGLPARPPRPWMI